MNHDVVILGAGGAGLMCAIHAARRGRGVLVIDHMAAIGGKILISGGGRCNFTNTGTIPDRFVSQDPEFCKSALQRFPAKNFINMVIAHKIPFHEKKLGQLFCDRSARDIVAMLKTECERAGVQFSLETKILKVAKTENFEIETSRGVFKASSLVVATGGLSIPQLGATGLGFEIAKQFGLRITKRYPALDGFIFPETEMDFYRDLSGVSVDCTIRCNGTSFRENLLFTHKGLSGPAVLQASLYWYPGDEITINLLPEKDAQKFLLTKKRQGSNALAKNALAEIMPARLADALCQLHMRKQEPLQQMTEAAIDTLATQLNAWTLKPSGTVGYNKAEVTRGGVDTQELSPQSMESKKVPGLYFVGEVVDVTGWLGGYNFQWAWASGWAASQTV